MRRILALLLILLMLPGGLGEDQMAELREIRKSAEEAIAQIQAPVPSETPVPGAPTPSPTPDMTPYEDLQNGSRGDEVKRLQQKLMDLGYLRGSADGVFGNKTAEAVRAFQQAQGLSATGVADAATQRALYALESAPSLVTYEALNYAALKPGGGQYEGTRVQFTGRVLQVLTDDTYRDTAGVYTLLRVATRSVASDVVYVYGFLPADGDPLQEGDQVVIRGTTRGHIVYENTAGTYSDLPRVEAEDVAIE